MTIQRETGPPMFLIKVSGGDREGVKWAESCCIKDYNGFAFDGCDELVAR